MGYEYDYKEDYDDVLITASPSTQNYNNAYYDLAHGFDTINNTTMLHPVSDLKVKDVWATFLFNLVAFAILMTLYEILLRKMPLVYAGRKLKMDDERKAMMSRMVSDLHVNETCIPFSWVRSVLKVPWKTVLDVSGLDAYFFLRFIRVCLKISLVSAFWGMILLWPTFYTGGAGLAGFYQLSFANVLHSNWRIWIPTGFMWLMTLYVIYILDLELKHYVSLRMEFLGRGRGNMKSVNPQARYSIIVEKIPDELQNDKALFNFFDQLFPGKVFSANVVLNADNLEHIIARRLRVVRRLEKAQAFHEATGKWATHVVGTPRCSMLGIECLPFDSFGKEENITKISRHKLGDETFEKGQRVDSVEYYTRELAVLNNEVLFLQRELKKVAEVGDDSYDGDWFRHIVDRVLSPKQSDFDPDHGHSRCSPMKYSYGSCDEENKRVQTIVSKQIITGHEKNHSLLQEGYLGDNGRVEIIQPGGEHKHRSISRRFLQKFGLDFLQSLLLMLKNHFDEVVIGKKTSSTGLVTFMDLNTVTYAATASLCHVPVLEAEVAPEPRDIIWNNLFQSKYHYIRRQNTANIFLVLGALLWSIPLVAIQALATADSLSRVPGMEWLESLTNNQLYPFLISYLPVVALLSLILILPVIFEYVAVTYEKRKTYSDVQNSVLNRYFYYQLANIYITVTAASIWDSLFFILQQPSAALKILGQTLPTVVGYFVSFLLTKILAGLPLILLRVDSLSKMMFYRSFSQRFLTQRELDDSVYRKEALLYGWEYPTQLLVIVICFTYACISPVILICGALYFQSALLVYKKQILFVYTPVYENGGAMFPSAVKRTLIGLICGQMTFIGFIVLRKGTWQSLILFPLPFITASIMSRFEETYVKPSSRLSVQRAKQLDSDENEVQVRKEFSKTTYRQPALATGPIYPMPYRRIHYEVPSLD